MLPACLPVQAALTVAKACRLLDTPQFLAGHCETDHACELQLCAITAAQSRFDAGAQLSSFVYVHPMGQPFVTLSRCTTTRAMREQPLRVLSAPGPAQEALPQLSALVASERSVMREGPSNQ